MVVEVGGDDIRARVVGGVLDGAEVIDLVVLGMTTIPPGCWPVVRRTPVQPRAKRFSSALVTWRPRAARYFFT